MNNEIMNISGIDCYEKDGIAYLKLETVARGLGFTRTAASGNEVIRWERVEGYLKELDVPTCGHDDFIPENIFYRLAMKAKNAVAEAFQAKVADEVIPSIRKTGGYNLPATREERLAAALLDAQEIMTEQKTRIGQLEASNSELTVQNTILQPKADYFDDLVDRNLLTNFTEAAKQLGVKRKALIGFMTEHGYLYRDKKGNLLPYANKKTEGLFEVKESSNQKTGWAGCQTLLTPKGVETFRLLCQGM